MLSYREIIIITRINIILQTEQSFLTNGTAECIFSMKTSFLTYSKSFSLKVRPFCGHTLFLLVSLDINFNRVFFHTLHAALIFSVLLLPKNKYICMNGRGANKKTLTSRLFPLNWMGNCSLFWLLNRGLHT